MLRRAGPEDTALINALWRAPQNAMWIEPPEGDEVADAVEQGNVYLWDTAGQVTGFAALLTWVPQVYGLSALCVTRPGTGEPLLRALLDEVFTVRGGHRIGFDVTVDNARALRLYDKLGFQREGHIRECWLRPDGRWVDCLLMGLLKREWTP
jgi:RimJ/RimL family protein N-acetyltransferase